MIYLDANATAAVRPQAQQVLSEHLRLGNGLANPSSVHAPGRRARAEIRKASQSVLRLLGFENSRAAQLIFTSGGTEACNQMILGALGSLADLVRYPQHIVSSSIEHPAVLETLERLRSWGWEIDLIDPAADGVVAPDDVAAALRSNTNLVCLMAANNETGIVQPVAELALMLRGRGYAGLIVSDLIQACGKSQISAKNLFDAGVDAVAVSAHKLGAFPGVGALVFAKNSSRCSQVFPLIVGGPQQESLRAGTENLPGICAFGAVAEHCRRELKETINSRRSLRELLWNLVAGQVEQVERITPYAGAALSNTLLVRVEDCRGDDLVVAMDINGVAVSTGSACASGKQGVSHVIKAMGYSGHAAREFVRFSIDWNTTEAEIHQAAEIFAATVRQIRSAQDGAEPRELGPSA